MGNPFHQARRVVRKVRESLRELALLTGVRRVKAVFDLDANECAVTSKLSTEGDSDPEEEMIGGGTDTPVPRNRKRSCQSDCAVAILQVLQQAANRLTGSQLQSEISERSGREWAENSVYRNLKKMMEQGHVSNEPNTSPPGYALTEKGRRYAVLILNGPAKSHTKPTSN